MLATEFTAAHLIECARRKRLSLSCTEGEESAMILLRVIVAISVIAASGSQATWAGDTLRITIPKRSELSPVQRLNREGVDAVKKHQYEKAAALFYKAYLYDPTDPFTLNNLGYISELEGELARANKFYALASEQGSNANIDRSNAKQLEGKRMQNAFESLQDLPMRVNRMNVEAMELLSEGRGVEAVALLRKALLLDALNPFTWNNLGVAEEAIGDYDNALKAYNATAETHSSEPVVLALDRSWRGRPVSTMAAASARRLAEWMKKKDSAELDAIMLTSRGVSATNQNDWLAAREDFLQAYSLDSASAFSLNNRGYVAEMEGDLETAQYFYDKARKAGDPNIRVGLASKHSAEGKKLSVVATDSDHQVDGELDKYSQDRRRQTGPIELIPRGTPPAGDSSVTPERPLSPDVPQAEAPSVLLSH
jgi:Flp pilus assembly protein TadD